MFKLKEKISDFKREKMRKDVENSSGLQFRNTNETKMETNQYRDTNGSKNIQTLVNLNTLQKNLRLPDAGLEADPYYAQVILLWLQASIGYLWYEAPEDEKNILTLLELLEADEVKEDDENYKNAVDILFEELEQKNPNHFAVKQRRKYKRVVGVIS